MGQKVNPIGFRTGVVRGWKSRWFASKQDFSNLLVEDLKIRQFIKNHPQKSQYRNAGIDRITGDYTAHVLQSPGFYGRAVEFRFEFPDFGLRKFDFTGAIIAAWKGRITTIPIYYMRAA